MREALLVTAAGLLASAASQPLQNGHVQMTDDQGARLDPVQSHPYAGLWVTADGGVRHRLLPGGRYDEARGARESAYRGRYEVRGAHIDYWDDTGFTADGEFVSEDELHHAGMVLRREPGAG